MRSRTLAALPLVVLSLAGCGGGGETGTTASTSSSSSGAGGAPVDVEGFYYPPPLSCAYD